MSTLSFNMKKCREKASSGIPVTSMKPAYILGHPTPPPKPYRPRHYRATPAVMSGPKFKCVIKTTHAPHHRRHEILAASSTGHLIIPDGHQRRGFSTYKCCRLGQILCISGRCTEHCAEHVTSPRRATRPTPCAFQRLGFPEAAGPLHVPREGFARQRGRLLACVNVYNFGESSSITVCCLAVVRGRLEDEDEDGTRIT